MLHHNQPEENNTQNLIFPFKIKIETISEYIIQLKLRPSAKELPCNSCLRYYNSF